MGKWGLKPGISISPSLDWQPLHCCPACHFHKTTCNHDVFKKVNLLFLKMRSQWSGRKRHSVRGAVGGARGATASDTKSFTPLWHDHSPAITCSDSRHRQCAEAQRAVPAASIQSIPWNCTTPEFQYPGKYQISLKAGNWNSSLISS